MEPDGLTLHPFGDVFRRRAVTLGPAGMGQMSHLPGGAEEVEFLPGGGLVHRCGQLVEIVGQHV